MNIVFDDGTAVRGDMVVGITLRHDMTPMPMTVEAVIRMDDGYQKKLKDGDVFALSDGGYKFKIVKVKDGAGRAGIQDDRVLSYKQVTAFMDDCIGVAHLQDKAVILRNTTFGEIYKALGCKVNIGLDVGVSDFACLKGTYASIQIAKQLHQEGAVMYWDGKSLNFVKCREVLNKKPKIAIAEHSTEFEESGFKLRHQVPVSYSPQSGSEIDSGKREKKLNGAHFAARETPMQMSNKQEFLVRNRAVNHAYDPLLRAGEVVQVGDKPHVILTAAHTFSTMGDTPSGSRLWLGVLNA